jgi:hypothetical protein
MHWTADHLLLWQSPITRESLLSAQTYYNIALVNMPHAFHLIHMALATSGAAFLLTKALGGRESNWLFDGASLFLYGATAVVHVQKIVPSLAELPALHPVPAANPSNPRDSLLVPLRELASSNAVQAAALVGVLILQSGQYYSERLERRERIEETEARLRRKRRRLERRSQQALRENAASSAADTSTSTAAS